MPKSHLFVMNLLEQAKTYAILCQAKGLIPPPLMAEQIVNVATGLYANQILKHLIQKSSTLIHNTENKERFRIIEQTLRDYKSLLGTKAFMSFGNLNVAYINFNFNNWQIPFTTSPEYTPTPQQIMDILHKANKNNIKLVIDYTASESGNRALWYWQDFEMKLFLPLPNLYTLDDFEKELGKMNWNIRNIQSSVEHELIHMVQTIGQIILNSKYVLGLPKKRPIRERKKGISPYGETVVNQVSTPTQPHAKRDVEFYTNLHEAIIEFNYLIQGLEPEYVKVFTKIFIGAATKEDRKKMMQRITHWPSSLAALDGTNWWFDAIKGTKRWKLAVKIFLEKVGY